MIAVGVAPFACTLTTSGSDYDPGSEGMWYRACSMDGENDYPYGDDYDPKKCVGDEYDGTSGEQPTDHTVPVMEAVDCEGGYPGIFGLSGNVAEWEDACDGYTGENDKCLNHSGSFRHDQAENQCSHAWVDSRKDVYNDTGFRCCADVP